jgi:acylphosphatase
MILRLKLRLYGRVQGVYFRKWSRIQAEVLGLSGFAQNQSDGSLIIEVQGSGPSLEEFVFRCKEGPERAVITDMDKSEIESLKEDGFIVT